MLTIFVMSQLDYERQFSMRKPTYTHTQTHCTDVHAPPTTLASNEK